VLWDRYLQLTQIEAAFKCLKSELGIRPIYHQGEQRVEAHILIAFLACSLWVTLKQRLPAHVTGQLTLAELICHSRIPPMKSRMLVTRNTVHATTPAQAT
jgi:transposase